MKRIVCLAALTAMLSISATAFADDAEVFTLPADYVGGSSDSATVNADGYSTVLITKDEENGEIVYIDQADDAYSASETFLLKTDPAYGKYKVTLGSETGAYNTYFYVGAYSDNNEDIAMTRLQNEKDNEDGTFNIGYYTDVAADFAETYNSIKVAYAGAPSYGGFDLADNWDDTHFEGEGRLYLVFQLNDVPSAMKDSVSVFLSKNTVGNERVNN